MQTRRESTRSGQTQIPGTGDDTRDLTGNALAVLAGRRGAWPGDDITAITRGRGRLGSCRPPALQRDPRGKPGAHRAQRPRPGRSSWARSVR